jgi:hypothetical protein
MSMRRGLAIGGACVGVVGAHVAAAVYFASHDPYTTQLFAPCPILTLTGWQCPGCGSTRALYSLLHGDLAQAFAMNPLFIACYASGLLLIAMYAAERSRRFALAKALNWLAVATVVVATAYTGLVRNLL